MTKAFSKSAKVVRKEDTKPAKTPAKAVKAPKKTVRSLADLGEASGQPAVSMEVPQSVAEAIVEAMPDDTTQDAVVVSGEILEAEEVPETKFSNGDFDQMQDRASRPSVPLQIEGVAEVSDLAEEADTQEGLVDNDDPRFALLQEIVQYVTICGYTQAHIDRAHNMSTPQLHDYLASLRVSAGGSIQVAELLAEVEEAYAETLASEDVKRKLAIVEAKGVDYVNLAQRVHRALGTDVVVNGLRYQDYHALVKHLVTHTSIVSAHIVDIASLLRITIPEQLENGGIDIPVVSGMQLNTKATLYILSVLLNNMRAWATSAAHADAMVKSAEKQRDEMEAFAKLKATQAKNAADALNAALASHAAETNRVASYLVEDDTGMYLAKKNEDAPLSFKNLKFVEHPFDAIPLATRLAAADLAERVSLHLGKELTPVKLVLMR